MVDFDETPRLRRRAEDRPRSNTTDQPIASLLQRGVRHCHRAECGDQEAVQTFSKRDTCEEGLQRVQADEAGQPQKRESRATRHDDSRCVTRVAVASPHTQNNFGKQDQHTICGKYAEALSYQ